MVVDQVSTVQRECTGFTREGRRRRKQFCRRTSVDGGIPECCCPVPKKSLYRQMLPILGPACSRLEPFTCSRWQLNALPARRGEIENPQVLIPDTVAAESD